MAMVARLPVYIRVGRGREFHVADIELDGGDPECAPEEIAAALEQVAAEMRLAASRQNGPPAPQP